MDKINSNRNPNTKALPVIPFNFPSTAQFYVSGE